MRRRDVLKGLLDYSEDPLCALARLLDVFAYADEVPETMQPFYKEVLREFPEVVKAAAWKAHEASGTEDPWFPVGWAEQEDPPLQRGEWSLSATCRRDGDAYRLEVLTTDSQDGPAQVDLVLTTDEPPHMARVADMLRAITRRER